MVWISGRLPTSITPDLVLWQVANLNCNINQKRMTRMPLQKHYSKRLGKLLGAEDKQNDQLLQTLSSHSHTKMILSSHLRNSLWCRLISLKAGVTHFLKKRINITKNSAKPWITCPMARVILCLQQLVKSFQMKYLALQQVCLFASKVQIHSMNKTYCNKLMINII